MLKYKHLVKKLDPDIMFLKLGDSSSSNPVCLGSVHYINKKPAENSGTPQMLSSVQRQGSALGTLHLKDL